MTAKTEAQASAELRDEVAMSRCLARRLERFAVTDEKNHDDPRRVAWRETLWVLLRDAVDAVPRDYPPHALPEAAERLERAAKIVGLLASERRATTGWESVSDLPPF